MVRHGTVSIPEMDPGDKLLAEAIAHAEDIHFQARHRSDQPADSSHTAIGPLDQAIDRSRWPFLRHD